MNQDLTYPLLSGLVKIAFAPTFAISKVLKASRDFIFRIPLEGSFLSVENIAIAKATKNPKLAHQFLDFVMSCDEMTRLSNLYGLNPANTQAYPLLNPEQTANRHVFPDDELFALLFQVPNTVSEKIFEEIWLAVKSA